MAKRKYKRYTIAEKLDYHTKRKDSEKATVNQRCRSREWCDGYNDRHYKNNLIAAQGEFDRRKGDKSKDNRDYCNNILKPYIRGMKARSEVESRKQ